MLTEMGLHLGFQRVPTHDPVVLLVAIDGAGDLAQISTCVEILIRGNDKEDRFAFAPTRCVLGCLADPPCLRGHRRQSRGFECPSIGSDFTRFRVGRLHELDRFRGCELRLGVAVVRTCRENHQRSQCTDHDGIDERLEARDHTLTNGLVGLRCRVGDRGRTLTRFGREQRPLDTPHRGVPECTTKERAGRIGAFAAHETGKAALDDQPEHGRDITNVRDEDHEGRDHINGAHQGDNAPGDSTDTLDATEDNQTHKHRQDNARNDLRHLEVGEGDISDIPCLEHVAAGDCRDDHRDHKDPANNRPDGGQTPFSKALLHHEHGPAVRVFRVVRIPIEHGLGDFGHLERHAQNANDPHPHDRARATQRHSNRDTRDVAKPHRRRQSRRQRLEVIDRSRVIVIVVLTPHDGNPVRQGLVLAEDRPEGEDDARNEQCVHRIVREENPIDAIDQVIQCHLAPAEMLGWCLKTNAIFSQYHTECNLSPDLLASSHVVTARYFGPDPCAACA